MVTGIRVVGGHLELDGYPAGSRVHGWDGPGAAELKRLAIFKGELVLVQQWLDRIPADGDLDQDAVITAAAFADAALMAFCRCFDFDHPLKPLKPKKVLSPEARPKLERLRRVRNRLVAHDNQLSNGVFSLIVQDAGNKAVEAVSLNLVTPFSVHETELPILRELCPVVREWIEREHWRVASEIVVAFDALSLEERQTAPPFQINVQPKDHYEK